MKRISGRQGLTAFIFISMLGFIHALFQDDLWSILAFAGMLIFFITSYFHSELLNVPISSLKQLPLLRVEMEVVPALLLWMGHVLIIIGLFGSFLV